MSKEELRRRVKEVKETSSSMDEDVTNALEELVALRAENARLKAVAKSEGTISFKVTLFRAPGTNGIDDKGSKGGALSVYGLGRFPVTLYKGQWLRLIAAVDRLKAFIETNNAILTEKD